MKQMYKNRRNNIWNNIFESEFYDTPLPIDFTYFDRQEDTSQHLATRMLRDKK
jgi:hypothetical protein